nr:hypothetical protein [Propionibacterium sp.]
MTDPVLTLDFAGEIYHPAPDGVFVIGRAGDLEIDDNPYLHRSFLEITFADGLWWVANVGARLPAHLTDAHGLMRTTLAPGARQPLVFPVTLLTFTAGSTTYEVLAETGAALYEPQRPDRASTGDTTIGPTEFTLSQKVALLALAEPLLRRAGTGASQVPSAVEAAARLGWPQSRFNRKLDNICEKLERSGVRGLRGEVGSSAANRRVLLVEYAVSTLLVTAGDLPMLDDEAALARREGTPR